MADIVKDGINPLIDCLTGKLDPIPRIRKINRCGLVYTDRVAIITGGAKGMGEGAVRVFVDAGAKVMFCDRDVQSGTRLENELKETGPGECAFEPCDVSKADQIKALIDKTIEHFGRLDCLYNNAGHNLPFRRAGETSLEEAVDLFMTNFFSQFVSCTYALPHLRKTKGNIINMGSCTGALGQGGNAIYSATKGAISAFTKSLAIEEATNGVRVNAVLPGNIYTESRRIGIESMGEKGPEVDRWAEAMQPMGRSGTPEEAGQIALFLASDAASYLTGLELMISGGIEIGQGMKYPSLYYDEGPGDTV